MSDDWLSETRTSYDTDASGYAEKVGGLLDGNPYLRASLALFAELLREVMGGRHQDAVVEPAAFWAPYVVDCSAGEVTGGA